MSLKIAHVSDIHIRNLKYHTDYRKVFDNLCLKLEELKPDIVVNTGDTAHTKTQISPEFVDMASEHMRRVSQIAPYHIILGNHDLNLMNPDRQDALTPIVESIKSDRIFLHKKSGQAFRWLDQKGTRYNFWVFSLADRANYPTPAAWAAWPDAVNIGLFHGSVTNCLTDMNWKMTHVEHDISIFDGLDYALLGDIHKQQFFRDKTIAYAGSLIQQNFGEELDKGFLFWELDGKRHRVTPHYLKGSRSFHTIRLADDLSIPTADIERGSRIRISPPRPITLVEQKEIEKEVKKRYQPHDVITLSSNNIGEQKIVVGRKTSEVENLRQIIVQERLIREFLKNENLSERVVNKVLEMNRRHQIHLEQEDEGARNVSWRINKIAWSNLFNYGAGNLIDFDRLGGLTGLFAPNGSGKSNLIDVILQTCFDATTKGVNKNIFLINDNKEVASAVAEIVANDQTYELTRHIEKIKYGQRSRDTVKEWGKTTVDFAIVDKDGGKTPLVGTLRPETEANIRQRLGSFDDFMLTSLLAQWNPMDIISAKETKRKEIIFRFLDLDIFGQKADMAKNESKEYLRKLEELEDDGLETALKEQREELALRMAELDVGRDNVKNLTARAKGLQDEIDRMAGEKVKVEQADLSDWAASVKRAEIEIATNQVKLAGVQERLKPVENELTQLSSLEKHFDLKLHEERNDRYHELDVKVTALDMMTRSKEVEHRTHMKNAALLGEVPCGDQFPSCKFLVNAFESKRKLDALESQVSGSMRESSEARSERDGLVPYVRGLETYVKATGDKNNLMTRKENLKLQAENLQLKIKDLQATKDKALAEKAKFEQMERDIKRNDAIHAQIYDLQKKRDLELGAARDQQESVDQVLLTIGSLQGALEKLETQMTKLSEVRETCLAYEHYIRVMGKDGIPYQVLTQKLPLINEEINKILSNVADFGVFLEHDVEEQSIRFFIQYGQYKSRLLELGSGAEKFLASIAIRNALLNISILPKTNMLIIDEGFGKLDPKNLESIQRMFDYLRTVFDHIVVISHLETMKDMVDNIIEITVDDEGYAHVSVGE